MKIKNFDDYQQNYSDESVNYTYAGKHPGTYANNLKVCTIDDAADQVIGITTTDLGNAGATIGFGVTTTISGVLPGAGSTSTVGGHLKAIITGVTTDATNGASTIEVKIVSRVSSAGTETAITYAESDLSLLSRLETPSLC